jgi:hypothetical protein
MAAMRPPPIGLGYCPPSQTFPSKALAQAGQLQGKIVCAGNLFVGCTVNLFYAAGGGAPTQLAQGKSCDDSAFQLEVGPVGNADGKVPYRRWASASLLSFPKWGRMVVCSRLYPGWF